MICDSDSNSTETVLTQAAEALAALEGALRTPHPSRDAVAAALVGARGPCRAADDALAQDLAARAAADTTRAVRDALQTWQQYEHAQAVPHSSSSSSSSSGGGNGAALEREVAERMALVQRVQTLRETLARVDSAETMPESAGAHEGTQSVEGLVALLHTQAQRIEEALAALAPEQTPAE